MIWLLIWLVIKKRNPVVSEPLISGRKLNIFPTFTTQSKFAVPKNISVNSTQYYIMKTHKQEPQQIAINHSLNIVF